MRQIDENLRRVYQEAANEDVPDRFQQLLQRLKEQDQKG
ncbi:regulator [Rhodobacteraceae bacterium MCCB 386]|nr:regulator [Roseitranquillus sediminis]